MISIPLSTRLNEETADLKELWELLANMSTNCVHDNTLYNGSYPVEIRERQLVAIRQIVDAIDASHKKPQIRSVHYR